MMEQLKEITGECLSQQDYSYHNPHYQSLLATVVPLRKAFRYVSVTKRKELAS
jgi:hypothetical protein